MASRIADNSASVGVAFPVQALTDKIWWLPTQKAATAIACDWEAV